jgi:hypothetical protein
MDKPGHISESLETIFWVKILKSFDAYSEPGSVIFLTLDPGSGMEKIRIRDKDPGSATLNKIKNRVLQKAKSTNFWIKEKIQILTNHFDSSEPSRKVPYQMIRLKYFS